MKIQGPLFKGKDLTWRHQNNTGLETQGPVSPKVSPRKKMLCKDGCMGSGNVSVEWQLGP